MVVLLSYPNVRSLFEPHVSYSLTMSPLVIASAGFKPSSKILTRWRFQSGLMSYSRKTGIRGFDRRCVCAVMNSIFEMLASSSREFG